MNYYNIVALVLAVVGFALLFFVDMLIVPSTSNETLLKMRDNHLLIGGVAIIVAYYVYTLGQPSEGEGKGNIRKPSLPSYDTVEEY